MRKESRIEHAVNVVIFVIFLLFFCRATAVFAAELATWLDVVDIARNIGAVKNMNTYQRCLYVVFSIIRIIYYSIFVRAMTGKAYVGGMIHAIVGPVVHFVDRFVTSLPLGCALVIGIFVLGGVAAYTFASFFEELNRILPLIIIVFGIVNAVLTGRFDKIVSTVIVMGVVMAIENTIVKPMLDFLMEVGSMGFPLPKP